MDKVRLNDLVRKKTPAPNIVSAAVTWISGKLLFKHDTKWANMYLGICHYSSKIFAISPSDYQYPKMVTTIMVAPPDNYCEKAYSCLYFSCHLNKFNKSLFLSEFKDCGAMSLGLPKDVGTKPLWFNDFPTCEKWKDFKIGVEGGTLEFDEKKGKELGIGG